MFLFLVFSFFFLCFGGFRQQTKETMRSESFNRFDESLDDLLVPADEENNVLGIKRVFLSFFFFL